MNAAQLRQLVKHSEDTVVLSKSEALQLADDLDRAEHQFDTFVPSHLYRED